MLNSLFYRAACFILLLFLVGGRGIAHAPIGPIFMGEAGLMLGFVAILGNSYGWTMMRLPAVQALVIYMTWGLIVTIPYIPIYGIDSFRDAVLWGYGVYALAWTGLLLSRPALIMKLFRFWKKYAVVLVLIGTASRFFTIFFNDNIPFWRGTDVPVIQVKGEELAGHFIPLAGYLLLTGGFWPWVVIGLGLIASLTVRAVIVGFILTLGIVAVIVKKMRSFLTLAVFLVGVFVVVSFVDLSPTGTYRSISGSGLRTNLESIFEETDDVAADGNREWRLDWWKAIIDYTIFGDRFFTGKGYGINLAVDDGFELGDDFSLRSPHNSHMSVLARSGVPGLCLWFFFLATWTKIVISSYKRSRRNGHKEWSQLFLVLFAYFLALLFMACFDVFLEGPSGGIWFWSICGIGIGAAAVYVRQYPAVVRLPVARVRDEEFHGVAQME